eukprot:2021985-Rhodomonas_salina.2
MSIFYLFYAYLLATPLLTSGMRLYQAGGQALIARFTVLSLPYLPAGWLCAVRYRRRRCCYPVASPGVWYAATRCVRC